MSLALWAVLASLLGVVRVGGQVVEPTEGRTHYVAADPNAVEANSGARVRLWQTLQKAADAARPGDTVVVEAGVYPETVYVRVDDVRFVAAQGARPVLDGQGERECGFDICARGVTISGFEVRNYTANGIRLSDSARGPQERRSPIDDAVIEFNHVHDIMSVEHERGTHVFGIHARANSPENAKRLAIRSNTVHDVRGGGESFGIFVSGAEDCVIRRNLCYFNDKAGIRLTDYRGPRQNCERNLIEGNICICNCTVGIETNSVMAPASQTTIRHNFCGWGNVGMNPKHCINAHLIHNTICGNLETGVIVNAPDFDVRPAVKNNILAGQPVGFHEAAGIVEGLVLDWNLYQPGVLPGCLFWQRHWDGMCFTVDEMRAKGWEANGRAGDPLFVAPDRGDYRPQEGSPARGAAEDGTDLGASRDVLTRVGAEGAWGLDRIPDLGEIPLSVKAVSSVSADPPGPYFPQNPGYGGEQAVDRSRITYWCPDGVEGEWIAFDLPGEEPYLLDHFIVLKRWVRDYQRMLYKDLRLWVRGPGEAGWQAVPATFTAYPWFSGSIFALPPGVRASEVKLEILDNFGGETVHVFEFMLFGRPAAEGPRGPIR